jgi:endogenous inhibitor of DNA gyrase (YacG/DUF329 family)
VKRYTCVICERTCPYDGPLPALYPFCSERCKMVDLGRWFRGMYSIDRDLLPEDAAVTPDADAHLPTSRQRNE